MPANTKYLFVVLDVLLLATLTTLNAAEPPGPRSAPASEDPFEKAAARQNVLVIGASSLNSPVPQAQLVEAMLASGGIQMDFDSRFPDLDAVEELLKTKEKWDFVVLDAWHLGRTKADWGKGSASVPADFPKATARFVKDAISAYSSSETITRYLRSANQGRSGTPTCSPRDRGVGPHRVNVKAGTYTRTSTADASATAGTTTAPIWWRGFNTAIGDLDNDFTTAKPLFQYTTGALTLGHAHQILSNISINTAKTTGAGLVMSGTNLKVHRCRIENTNAGASSCAINNSGGNSIISESWIKATTTASQTIVSALSLQVYGTTVVGGIIGWDHTGGNCIGLANIYTAYVTSGVSNSLNNTLLVAFCDFYGGTNGVKLITTMPNNGLIIGNNFEGCTNGINNASGTNTNVVQRTGNRYKTDVTNKEVGFGDSPDFSQLTEAASAFNSAGTDFSLVTSSNAKAGVLGQYENMSGVISYFDVGPVQLPIPASTAVPRIIGG